MTRIVISLLVAPIASVLGYLALWSGGTVFSRALLDRTSSGLDPLAVLFVVLGVLLLVVAMATIAFSSVGVIVVGVIHLLVSLLAVLGPAKPFLVLLGPLYDTIPAVADGLLYSIPTGVGMLAGVIFLVAGLAALSRRPARPGVLARIASVVIGLAGGLIGLVLAVSGGGLIYTSQMLEFRELADQRGALLLLVGVALLAVAVATLRWSSLGVATLGLVVVVIGALGITQPGDAVAVTRDVSVELSRALQFVSANGNLAMLGMLLLAAALGTLLRSRRRG
jgi:hypothetical protein